MKQTVLPKQVSLVFHHDIGHSWLEAPTQLVRDTHISGIVSRYSYLSSDCKKVYLEEGRDAGLLIDALKRRGVEIVFGDNKSANDRSFIRSLPRYAA